MIKNHKEFANRDVKYIFFNIYIYFFLKVVTFYRDLVSFV